MFGAEILNFIWKSRYKN